MPRSSREVKTRFEGREVPEDFRLGPFWDCPNCGARQMVFIRPYERYFCLKCRTYSAKENEPKDSSLQMARDE